MIDDSFVADLVEELVERHGESQRDALTRGIEQVRSLWLPEDGTEEDLGDLVRAHFAADPSTRDGLFQRLEAALASLAGHLEEATRDMRFHSDVDTGPLLPFDQALAGYDPTAHLVDDWFQAKLAFVVLLNFPLTSLAEREAKGASWSRRQWAEARLAPRFAKRVPAGVTLEHNRALTRADQYVANYNIHMHNVLAEDGSQLFPPGLRLISHWNLREELATHYNDPTAGLAQQRTIHRVMERIIDQSIPEVVVDNPDVDWNPFTNTIVGRRPDDDPSTSPEPDTRYQVLLEVYRTAREADPHCPASPTAIARSFDETRELPEERVVEILESVLTSPSVKAVADVIRDRLGRELEAFDLWYPGFRVVDDLAPEELNALTRARYPTAADFAADLPRLLNLLGFPPERCEYLADRIEVHPARGAGHAYEAGLPSSKAFLRTRVQADGMDRKGYTIAIHELGHNVEQTFSLNDIDHYLLHGVPNDAIAEALAFVFQAEDLRLLGLAHSAKSSTEVLQAFWGTVESSGVAMVDLGVWHWLYDNPEATATDLREATVRISREVWNRYFAPAYGVTDSTLLGIYSHMIAWVLYLPDYPIGHLIAHQLSDHMAGAPIGPEYERISRIGRLTPDRWMLEATGSPISAQPMLEAVRSALSALGAG